jgi:hypothetical protein
MFHQNSHVASGFREAAAKRFDDILAKTMNSTVDV